MIYESVCSAWMLHFQDIKQGAHLQRTKSPMWRTKIGRCIERVSRPRQHCFKPHWVRSHSVGRRWPSTNESIIWTNTLIATMPIKTDGRPCNSKPSACFCTMIYSKQTESPRPSNGMVILSSTFQKSSVQLSQRRAKWLRTKSLWSTHKCRTSQPRTKSEPFRLIHPFTRCELKSNEKNRNSTSLTEKLGMCRAHKRMISIYRNLNILCV